MPSATRSLTLVADVSSLQAAMRFVEDGALEAKLPERRAGELSLLIEEIFMNVCSHAYAAGSPGVISLSYSIPAPGELSVEVGDQGAEFNPLNADPPDIGLNLDNRPIGGLGILLMKTLAPSMTYRREGDWNYLSLHISASS